MTQNEGFKLNYAKYYASILIENGAYLFPLSELFTKTSQITDQLIFDIMKHWMNNDFDKLLNVDNKMDLLKNSKMYEKNKDWEEYYHCRSSWMKMKENDNTCNMFKFIKIILQAKKKFYVKKRVGVTFLMGTHEKVEQNSSTLKFVKNQSFDINLIKCIFQFAALHPFQPHYM